MIRRLSPRLTILTGLVAACLYALAYHAAVGGPRFTARVEAHADFLRKYYEREVVTARLARDPLSRLILLSGPGDDFQRGEMARVMDEIPGVVGARWDGARRIPLALEALLFAAAAYGTGLTFAFLLALRARARNFDRF